MYSYHNTETLQSHVLSVYPSLDQAVNTNDQDTPRLAAQSLDPAGIVENPHPQTVASSLKCPVQRLFRVDKVATCKQSWASPLRCVAGWSCGVCYGNTRSFPSARLPVPAPTSRPHVCKRAVGLGSKVYEVLTTARETPPARNKCRSIIRPENIYGPCPSPRIT